MISRWRRRSLLVALLSCSANCGREEPPRRPNILFVSIDTLRADHLGLYGYKQPTSPNLDAFAQTAVVFDEAFSHSSWTLPSFATMLTSTPAQTHACSTFDHALSESFTTIPEILVEAGYRTAAVISHVFLGPRHGLTQGIQELDQDLLKEILESHMQISSPEVTRKGITFLEDAAKRDENSPPWMLWLHYFDPHEHYRRHPETVAEFPGETSESLYDGEIAFTDLWLGKVFDALTRLNLADDTIVVVVSDHGEEFGDHGGTTHGKTLYREVVRVPFLIRAPGIDARRIQSTVRTLDLMPTLLELCGIRTPGFAQGQSLVPAMRGETIHDLPVYTEIRLRSDYLAESVQMNGWKLILDHSGASARKATDIDTRLPGVREKPSLGLHTLLFNVRVDPGETVDRASQYPDIVQKLNAYLSEERARARKLAESFAAHRVLDLDPAARQQLEQLGY
jgi:arylsulfatase A-like enzyme